MALSEAQRRQAAFHYAGLDIPTILEQREAARGSHPFLLWEPVSGESRRWSYSEFRREVLSIAAGLAARGIARGDRVLIHAENCPEMVMSWYACSVVGAIAVTTNTGSVASELSYYAGQAKVRAAITQPKFARLVADHGGRLDWLVVTRDTSGDAAAESDVPGEPFESLRGNPSAAPRRAPEPLLPAGIIYTSGTTSRPKAVVHTHANFLWAGRIGPLVLDFGPDDVHFAYLPFFHTNAQLWATATALGAGGSVLLVPRVSVSGFWPAVVKHGVTHMTVLPLLDRGTADMPVPAGHRLKVLQGGTPQVGMATRVGARGVAAYGMTETVIHTIHASSGVWSGATLGRPTPGYEVRLVNQETGQECVVDEPGECQVRGVRGVQLFLEYYDNPEANEKAFTADGWFRTGDIMKLGADGCYYYLDRDKDRLRVGGENVSASEVERLILQVPGVSEAAVVAKADAMLGSVPVAFVLPKAGIDHAALRAAIAAKCEAELSKFKRPREIRFVEDFPRATLNKIAKAKLREMLG